MKNSKKHSKSETSKSKTYSFDDLFKIKEISKILVELGAVDIFPHRVHKTAYLGSSNK